MEKIQPMNQPSLMHKNSPQFDQKIACVSIFFLVGLMVFWRAPHRVLDGFLWAEDVSVFLKSAYEAGAHSLTTPYAGYFHLLPRAIAYLQTWAGTPLNAPYFYMWSSVIFGAAGSAYIFHVATRYTGHLILSAFAAFAPFYVVHSGEVFCSITNLQWVLASTLLALLVDLFILPQRSSATVAAKTISMFCLGLTGPFSLLFMPIALLILFNNRKNATSPRIAVPAIGLLAAVLIQAWSTANSLSESSALKPHPWLDRFLLDYLSQMFLSKQIISLLEGTYVFWVIPFLLLVSVLASGKKSFAPILLFSYSVGLWVIGVMRVNDPNVTMGPLSAGARYYLVPSVCMAWALILCIKECPSLCKPVPALLLACMFFTGMAGFNADVHKTWSVIPKQEGVYEVTAPPGWSTTIR